MLPTKKFNIFNVTGQNSKRDWSKFNHEEFILDCFGIDWPHVPKLERITVGAIPKDVRTFLLIFDPPSPCLQLSVLAEPPPPAHADTQSEKYSLLNIH